MAKLTITRDAERLLQAWEEFNIGSLSAIVVRGPLQLGALGDLPNTEADKLRALAERAKDTGERLYIVRHYHTPIAWQIGMEDEVYLPAYRYSISTTAMQVLVARAYGMHWYSWVTERAVPSGTYADAAGGSWQAHKYS